MKKFTEVTQDALLKAAKDANFWGKRKRDTKLECIENLKEFASFEVGQLVDWLEENKPILTKAAKAASNKKAFDHIQGSEQGLNLVRQGGADCYILTSCQNNTEINKDFLAALETYASAKRAKLLVGGFTYNKTGYQTDRDNNAFFNSAIQPYLVKEPIQLFEGLIFASELDIIPTATAPCNGHTDYFAPNSLIIPHAKIALLSQATPTRENARFVYSTGALSLKNYRQQRAGQRAEQTHSISALIAEKCDTRQGWQVRQLHWVNDHFIDLAQLVTANNIIPAPPASALTLGDLHSEKMDQDNLDQALNIIEDLDPEHVFLHDTLDFESRNSHRRNDHLFIAAQNGSIKDDVYCAVEVLTALANASNAQFYCVRSNHDEQIERWLVDKHYNFMLDTQANARLYLDLQSLCYSYIEKGERVPDLFDLTIKACGYSVPDNIRFLTRNCSVKIQGVLKSSHGDQGSNGARGSLNGLAKLYSQGATIGHSHSCGISGNVYQTGCMNLYQGYNENGGLSSWSISHVIQYANGTRSVLTY